MSTSFNTNENSFTDADARRLATDIVSAYVSNNLVDPTVLPELIRIVHGALNTTASPTESPSPNLEKPKPAVPISRSVHHDYIVCLEDGKHLTMLKRYLNTRYGLSPEEYRRKWGLKPDYPMVAPAYAARRSEFAKSIGLGTGVRRRR